MAFLKRAPNRAPPAPPAPTVPPPALHIFPGDNYRSKPFYSTISSDNDESPSTPTPPTESLMGTCPSSPDTIGLSDYLPPAQRSSGSSSIAWSLSKVLRRQNKSEPPKAFKGKAEPVRLVDPEEGSQVVVAPSLSPTPLSSSSSSMNQTPAAIALTKSRSTAISIALETPTIQPYTEDDDDEDDLDEPELYSENQSLPLCEIPPLILITGATSSLGLAFFHHFAARNPAHPSIAHFDVLGIDKVPWRLPGKGFQWQTPVSASGHFVQLDLATASPKRLASFAKTYLHTCVASPPRRRHRPPKKTFYPRPVTLVLDCAPADAVEQRAALEDAHVRSSVLLLLTQTLLPHLRLETARIEDRFDHVSLSPLGARSRSRSDRPEELASSRTSLVQAYVHTGLSVPRMDPPPRVVVIGSQRWGGMSGNSGGGGFAYRESLAAVYAVVKSLSVDVPEVCFACVSPGMDECRKEEDGMRPDDIVTDLLPLLGNLGKEGMESGCFVDRFGESMKWSL